MNPVWKLNFFLFNIEGYGEFFSGITPEFLQREIGVVSLWSIQVKRRENLNANFFTIVIIFIWW
jgi:hypothetical protein